MIKLTQGDILSADAEALVNTVNCVGVMGRGIALQFKKAFPENFKHYKTACDRKELLPGVMLIHDLHSLCNPRYVINFPTKRHWKGKSRMADIESGLRTLVEAVRKRNIHSIAIPPLGCGLGGLRWADVRVKIEEAFQELADVRVLLYEPIGAPPAAQRVVPQSAKTILKMLSSNSHKPGFGSPNRHMLIRGYMMVFQVADHDSVCPIDSDGVKFFV